MPLLEKSQGDLLLKGFYRERDETLSKGSPYPPERVLRLIGLVMAGVVKPSPAAWATGYPRRGIPHRDPDETTSGNGCSAPPGSGQSSRRPGSAQEGPVSGDDGQGDGRHALQASSAAGTNASGFTLSVLAVGLAVGFGLPTRAR